MVATWRKKTAVLLATLMLASAGGTITAYADGNGESGLQATQTTASVAASVYSDGSGNADHQGNSGKGGGVADSVYAPPEFAGRVDDFFNQLDDLYNTSDNFHNDDFKGKIDQARQIADNLPSDVKDRLYLATQAVPGWDQLPSSSHGVAKGMKDAKDRADNGKSKGHKGGAVGFVQVNELLPYKAAVGILSADVTSIDTSINCPDSPDQTTLDALDLEATLATTGSSIASFVASMLPSELVEGGVVLGEGAVTTLPDPLRIAAEAVATGFAAGAQAITIEKNVLQLAYDNSNGCSSDAQTQLIQNIGNMLNHMNGTLDNTRISADQANAAINQLNASINQSLTGIAGKIDSHDASVSTQFGGVNSRIDSMTGAMAKQADSTANQLTALFAKLDDTLKLLQSTDAKVDQANGSLQSLSGKADQLGANLDQANGKLDDANKALTILDGNVNEANAKLDTANGSLNVAQTKLDTISGHVDTANQKLDTVNQKADVLIQDVQTTDAHVLAVSDRQLEEDLSAGTMLVSLYLPNSAGGYLENVRDLVGRLIDQTAAAGLDASQAKTIWQKAVSAEDGGSYQTALKTYINAYHQLQTSAVSH